MKIGTELQFECPDKCPKDCKYTNDIMNYGQNAMCGRCPVFVCREPITEEDEKYMPMVPAQAFRDDWAEEWDKFFKTNINPELRLIPKEE